jgi:hypothetical protein
MPNPGSRRPPPLGRDGRPGLCHERLILDRRRGSQGGEAFGHQLGELLAEPAHAVAERQHAARDGGLDVRAVRGEAAADQRGRRDAMLRRGDEPGVEDARLCRLGRSGGTSSQRTRSGRSTRSADGRGRSPPPRRRRSRPGRSKSPTRARRAWPSQKAAKRFSCESTSPKVMSTLSSSVMPMPPCRAHETCNLTYAGKRICFRRLLSNADSGTNRRSRLTWRAVRPAA